MSDTIRTRPHFVTQEPWGIGNNFHPSLAELYKQRNLRISRKVRKDHVKDGYISKPLREPNTLGTLGWAEIEGQKQRKQAKRIHYRNLRRLGKNEIESQLRQMDKDFREGMKELFDMERDLGLHDDYDFSDF
jgi:hypothetical protein